MTFLLNDSFGTTLTKYKLLKKVNFYKILTFFITKNSQDIAKCGASIGKFSKQAEVYKQDKERWMGRFKTSRSQLAEIQTEIDNMVSKIPVSTCKMVSNFGFNLNFFSSLFA